MRFTNGEKSTREQNENQTPPPHKQKGSLTLNNLKNTRQTLARIIRLYNAGDISQEKYKNLIYGISTLAHIFKAEFEISSEERIKAIEKALEELQGAKRG